MSIKKESNRKIASNAVEPRRSQKVAQKHAVNIPTMANGANKRKTEKNPTYRSREELAADLHAFRGRLGSVTRIISLMFGLQKFAADDLYQTVFEKAWIDPTRVPAKRGQWSWLLKVAYRTAVSTFRSDQRFVFADLDAGLDAEETQEDCDVAVLRAVVHACSASFSKVAAVVDVRMALAELAEQMPQETALLALNTMGNCSVRDTEELTGVKRTRGSKMIRTAKEVYQNRFPAHKAYVV